MAYVRDRAETIADPTTALAHITNALRSVNDSVLSLSDFVAMKYTPFNPPRPTPSIERPLRLRLVGQSGTKRRLAQLENVHVWARLVDVNSRAPEVDIKGQVSVSLPIDTLRARCIAERINSFTKDDIDWSMIKVYVRRLRRDI